jgi:hypothetical protein
MTTREIMKSMATLALPDDDVDGGGEELPFDIYKPWGNELVIACFETDRAAVEQLLDGGADINSANEIGMTPFYAACIGSGTGTECVALAKFLVSRGADKRPRTMVGDTPLITACIYGRARAVEYLLGEVADTELEAAAIMSGDSKPTTALHWSKTLPRVLGCCWPPARTRPISWPVGASAISCRTP